MTAILHQAGREPIELTADNLKAAKRDLAQRARMERDLCRARFGKSNGKIHKCNAFQYLITIGKDPRSSLWTSLSLEVVP